MLRDVRNSEVIWPFMIGGELLAGRDETRWLIDFQNRDINVARTFSAPFARLEDVVLPYISEKANEERQKTGLETGQDQTWLKSWWQLFRPRSELIDRITALPRYIVCSRHTKRPIFVFLSPQTRPGDALSVFTFDDDYSFGILQSAPHWQWFIEKGSKIKSDFRYTPESVFDTFPWPQFPDQSAIEAVAESGRKIRKIRAEILPKLKGGLRALYRNLELPGANPLKDAHAALDAAVLAAYGFNPKTNLLAQLLDLNQQVAARIGKGEPVTAPGLPLPDAKRAAFITEDCIKPRSD